MTPALSLTLRARRAADVLALAAECSAILDADTPADLHRALARAEVRLRRLRHDVDRDAHRARREVARAD